MLKKNTEELAGYNKRQVVTVTKLKSCRVLLAQWFNEMTESRNRFALRRGYEILLRAGQVKIVHLHAISTLRGDEPTEPAMSHNESSLNIQSFNYLMYQLHHFFNYERRILQFADKDRSRRCCFHLCHQKKRSLL